jgi:hypothetical protein
MLFSSVAIKMQQKNSFLLIAYGTFTSVFKDNKFLKSHNRVQINFFKFFLLFMVGSGSVKIITDPDPDGPKT